MDKYRSRLIWVAVVLAAICLYFWWGARSESQATEPPTEESSQRPVVVPSKPVAVADTSTPTYELSAHGMHAGKITRDRDAVRSFNPVGVWAVPQDDTVNSPTIAFMYVYPDGSMAMLQATDCKVLSVAQWEMDYVTFRIIEKDGSETESVIVGVPGKRYINDDGDEVYSLGQRVLFGSARYWDFASPNVNSEC